MGIKDAIASFVSAYRGSAPLARFELLRMVSALASDWAKMSEQLRKVQAECTILTEERRTYEARIDALEGEVRALEAEVPRRGASDLVRDVREFHAKFGVPLGAVPLVPADERVRLRARLVAEEAFELLEAVLGEKKFALLSAKTRVMNAIDHGSLSVDMPALADACADLDYVVEGLRAEFGIDGEPVASLVHASNMAKAGGLTRDDGKILKPEGWAAPDVAGELRRQGWEGGGSG